MSRSVLVVLALVAACHAGPPPRTPALSHQVERTPAVRQAPSTVDREPDWFPKRRRRVVTSTSITILDDLQFLPGSGIIDPKTTPILDGLVTSMLNNPEITRLAIRTFAPDVAPHWQQIIADQRVR